MVSPPEEGPPPAETPLLKMYYLYVIQSISHRGWHYIGTTSDITKRIAEHNRGKTRSTKYYAPFELVHKEEYNDKRQARKREIFLKKTAKARKELFEKTMAPSSNG